MCLYLIYRNLTQSLKAHNVKEKYDLKVLNISTMSGYLLSTLPERDQTRIVAQLQKGVISKDLQGYVPKLKKLSEEVKNAVLKVEDPIPIDDAEFIEKFKPEEKKEMINWVQTSKKRIKDEIEYKLKISKGEVVPEITIELDPQEKIFESVRNLVLNIINRINLPYISTVSKMKNEGSKGKTRDIIAEKIRYPKRKSHTYRNRANV